MYTVSVQFRFKLTWNKLLSCRSLGTHLICNRQPPASCSVQSLFAGHCFEFFIVLIMIVCGGFTISVSATRPCSHCTPRETQSVGHVLLRLRCGGQVFRRSPEFKQQAPEGGGAAIIYVLFGITVLLVPLTLKKASGLAVLPELAADR